MRHISFDESTVLNEFARIANERKLIKNAQDDSDTQNVVVDGVNHLTIKSAVDAATDGQTVLVPAGDYPAQLSKESQEAPVLPLSAKQEREVSMPSVPEPPWLSLLRTMKLAPQVKKYIHRSIVHRPPNMDQFLKYMAPLAGPKADPKTRALFLPELQKVWQSTYGDKEREFYSTTPVGRLYTSIVGTGTVPQYADDGSGDLADLARGIRKTPPATYQPPTGRGQVTQRPSPGPSRTVPPIQTKLPPGYGKTSSYEDEGFIITNARDEAKKFYDVTGETGEQLVEKAHPGGGTRTELTHSKTDENLVETIVEQQERDVEVARSVPKGTYAELMSLYNSLNKMGYSEHLGELKNIIASVATFDEVSDYVLSTLANRLNALGHNKYADAVNTFKKKVAQRPPWSKQRATEFQREVLNKLRGLPADRFMNIQKDQVIKEWQQKSAPTLTEAVYMARALSDRWGRSFPQLFQITKSTTDDFSALLEDEQEYMRSMRMLSRRRQPGVAGDEPQPERVTRKRYKRGPKIKAFQKWFNEQIKGTPYERAGQALEVDSIYGRKTRGADMLVRSFGGRSAFAKAMEKKRAPKLPELPKTPAPKPSLEPIKWSPESVAVDLLQRRFGRLPLNRAPELVNIVKQWGREEFGSAGKVFSEEKARQEAIKQLEVKINSLTSEDVKQYIRM